MSTLLLTHWSVGLFSFLFMLLHGHNNNTANAMAHSSLRRLSATDLFNNILSTDEMTALLIQSKHGSNANVSTGYKIERALKSLSIPRSKQPTNVFQFWYTDVKDLVQNTQRQEVSVGSLLSKSLVDCGLPCLCVWTWGLKSVHSSIPLSSSTLMRITGNNKRKKNKIRKELVDVLNSFVPAFQLKYLNHKGGNGGGNSNSNSNSNSNGKQKQILQWIRKGKMKSTRVAVIGQTKSPPVWLKRLSLLYASRVRFAWTTVKYKAVAGLHKDKDKSWIRWYNSTIITKIPTHTLASALVSKINATYVPRLRTRHDFETICASSCILGVFQFGNLRGGQELEALRALASRAFARVQYGERGLADMKIDRAPVKFAWIMASQQETLVRELNLFRTPCLVSLHSKRRVYTVHQSRIPMNVDKMYQFVQSLLTGQRNKVTKWISDLSGGFETLIDTELDSNEPTDLPVWYDAL